MHIKLLVICYPPPLTQRGLTGKIGEVDTVTGIGEVDEVNKIDEVNKDCEDGVIDKNYNVDEVRQG